MADIAPVRQRGDWGIMAVMEMVGQVALLYLLSLIWESHETLVFYIIAAGLLVGFGITFLSVKEPTPIPPAPRMTFSDPVSYVPQSSGSGRRRPRSEPIGEGR